MWGWLSWWRDWRDFRALPYGGADLLAQPAYVTQVIRACESTYQAVMADRAEAQRRAVEAQQRQLQKPRRPR